MMRYKNILYRYNSSDFEEVVAEMERDMNRHRLNDYKVLTVLDTGCAFLVVYEPAD